MVHLFGAHVISIEQIIVELVEFLRLGCVRAIGWLTL